MRAACILLVVLVAACPASDDTKDDTRAAAQVASAFDSTGELARLVQPLEASPDLTTTPDAPTQVNAARTAFRALVANPNLCTTIVTTANSIDVTFRNCIVALVFRLDGSLHADVQVDATAVTTTVATPGLTLASADFSQSVAGNFVLRQPFNQQAMPVELDGAMQFANSMGKDLALSLSSQWTVTRMDAKTCVDFTGGAEMSGSTLGELGPISLAGDSIKSCRDECPTSGHVELSYGAGNLLVWNYNGSKTTTVSGPHGKTVVIELTCGKKKLDMPNRLGD